MNDYIVMSKAINFLSEHVHEQPSLEDMAIMAGLSPSHFHRKFKSWVGVSPKSFLQCLTLENAKIILNQDESIMDVALNSGLSGPGRLHDLCIKLDAATPGEIKNGGMGLNVGYGFGPTPFGECIVANSQRGICYMAFIDSDKREKAINELQQTWPGAKLKPNNDNNLRLLRKIFTPSNDQRITLKAFVSGTQFQLQVWRALLNISEGQLTSYGKLANSLNRPGAARAVGSAVASNFLAYLIPCHRVIRSSGIIGDYRWGSARKKTIIAYETAKNLML